MGLGGGSVWQYQISVFLGRGREVGDGCQKQVPPVGAMDYGAIEPWGYGATRPGLERQIPVFSGRDCGVGTVVSAAGTRIRCPTLLVPFRKG